MSVAGEGRMPTREHDLAVAKTAGMKDTEANVAIDRVNVALARASVGRRSRRKRAVPEPRNNG